MSTYDPGRTLWAHLGWTGRRVDPRDGPRSPWRLVQQSPERWVLEDGGARGGSKSIEERRNIARGNDMDHVHEQAS